MTPLSTENRNSSKEKNFKARSKKKIILNYSQFDDAFDEIESYPQLNRF